MDRQLMLESEIDTILERVKEAREKGNPDEWTEIYVQGMKRALEIATGNEYVMYNFKLQQVCKA